MIKNWIKGSAILFAFWLVLSGHFEGKYVIVGLLASVIIARICVPLLSLKDRNGERYSILQMQVVPFTAYWLWLFGEICKSSLSVAKTVLKREIDIQPQIIEFYCVYCNPVAVTMLINSIILTPGTVTIDVRDDSKLFVVHALTDQAAEGLLEGTMQTKIGKLFGEEVQVDFVRKGACA